MGGRSGAGIRAKRGVDGGTRDELVDRGLNCGRTDGFDGGAGFGQRTLVGVFDGPLVRQHKLPLQPLAHALDDVFAVGAADFFDGKIEGFSNIA